MSVGHAAFVIVRNGAVIVCDILFVWSIDELTALYAERDENTQRDDFSPSEMVIHSRRIERIRPSVSRTIGCSRPRSVMSAGEVFQLIARSARLRPPIGLSRALENSVLPVRGGGGFHAALTPHVLQLAITQGP